MNKRIMPALSCMLLLLNGCSKAAYEEDTAEVFSVDAVNKSLLDAAEALPYSSMLYLMRAPRSRVSE